MAKKKNFTQNIQEKTMSLTNTSRTMRRRFLIVCEGKETEPNYFKSFAVRNYIDVITEGGKGSPSRVLKTAKDLRDHAKKEDQPYDSVWVVFDKDDFHDFDIAINDAKKDSIGCAWSNRAFELWFVYYFENLRSCITDYVKRLEGHIRNGAKKKSERNYYQFKYTKSLKGVRDVIIKCGGNEDNAIMWAEYQAQSFTDKQWATHTPCTTVYLLVKQLLGLDEKFDDEISNMIENGSARGNP
jgi:hypothetical protein